MDLYIHSRSLIFTAYRSACCLYSAEWVGGYYMPKKSEYASSAHPLVQRRSIVPKPWALKYVLYCIPRVCTYCRTNSHSETIDITESNI